MNKVLYRQKTRTPSHAGQFYRMTWMVRVLEPPAKQGGFIGKTRVPKIAKTKTPSFSVFLKPAYPIVTTFCVTLILDLKHPISSRFSSFEPLLRMYCT